MREYQWLLSSMDIQTENFSSVKHFLPCMKLKTVVAGDLLKLWLFNS